MLGITTSLSTYHFFFIFEYRKQVIYGRVTSMQQLTFDTSDHFLFFKFHCLVELYIYWVRIVHITCPFFFITELLTNTIVNPQPTTKESFSKRECYCTIHYVHIFASSRMKSMQVIALDPSWQRLSTPSLCLRLRPRSVSTFQAPDSP